jgi:hypothetical protein
MLASRQDRFNNHVEFEVLTAVAMKFLSRSI